MLRTIWIIAITVSLAACSAQPAPQDPAPTETPESSESAESESATPDNVEKEEPKNVSGTTSRFTLKPDRTLLADTGEHDVDLLLTLRRQFFVASPTKRAMVMWAIAEATPTDPKIKKLHELCVDSFWPVEVGQHWLEGIVVAGNGMTDQRTMACMDAVMAEVERRGLVEKSVEGVEKLADYEAMKGQRAFDTTLCHLESDDIKITRVKQLEPRPLQRPEGVSEGSTASIIVRFDEAGQAHWVGTVGEAGPGAEACFDALSGKWSEPRNTEADEPAVYCKQFRCQF